MSKHSESKVVRGERLSIQAETWNTLIDVARSYKRDFGEPGANNLPGSGTGNLSVLVQNNSGSTLTYPFKVLKINNTVDDVNADPLNSFSVANFKGIVPTNFEDPIVITQTNLDTSAIGEAVVSGVTQVKLLVNSIAHKYARPVPGQTGYLETSTSGPCKVIWIHGTAVGPPDIRWGIVHLIGSNVGISDEFEGSGICGCGWIKGVQDGDCFTLTLMSPLTGDVPNPLALYWIGDPTTGYAEPPIDPATGLPYTFTICGIEYSVRLSENADGEPTLVFTQDGGSGSDIVTVLSLDCCILNGAYYTGTGRPECFNPRPDGGPAAGVFRVKIEWNGLACQASCSSMTRTLPTRLYITFGPMLVNTTPFPVSSSIPYAAVANQTFPLQYDHVLGKWYMSPVILDRRVYGGSDDIASYYYNYPELGLEFSCIGPSGIYGQFRVRFSVGYNVFPNTTTPTPGPNPSTHDTERNVTINVTPRDLDPFIAVFDVTPDSAGTYIFKDVVVSEDSP